MPYKVLVADQVSDSGIQLLRDNGYEVIFAPNKERETLKALIADCDAVFSATTFFDEELLSAGKKLKVVSKHGVGIDNVVNADTATKLGIYVVRTPLANMNSVAEHTITAMLALAKQVVPMDTAMRDYVTVDAPNHPVHTEVIDGRETQVPDSELLAFESAPSLRTRCEIGGKRLGIIGVGNIGKSLAKMAALGFDMKVLGYDPFVDPKVLAQTHPYIEMTNDPDEIFRTCDFVSLHLSASPENNQFVDRRRLELMKPTAFLINFSRGSNLNETDLYHALKEHRIAGAALDVYADEAHFSGNPLRSLDNVLLSPHCSALTVEAMDRMSYQGCQGIVEILSGKKPTWGVNYEEVSRKDSCTNCNL